MPSYASVADLKTSLGISDTTDDATLADVLEEASRDIDGDTHRFFFQTAAGTVAYYTPTNDDWVLIDDCVALTAVETDDDGDRTYETTWAATDYDLLPDNAALSGLPYAYDKIMVTPDGDYSFPAGVRKGLKLTGTWGWSAVPDKIRRACVIRAAWLFKRQTTPLGVSGTPELGMMRVGRFDPDYERLISEYKRPVVT